jgi:hypothetical protein
VMSSDETRGSLPTCPKEAHMSARSSILTAITLAVSLGSAGREQDA